VSAHEKSVTTHEKSVNARLEWVEEDVLREYNGKIKDRQLELTYHRFVTYATATLSSLTQTVPPQLLTHRLTYLQFLAALKDMALIRDNYEPLPSDAPSALWSELGPHGHTCGALMLFLASILLIRRSDDPNAAKYVHLSKQFAELRYTRFELLGKTKTAPEEEEFPFTPTISQKSRVLASSRSRSRPKSKCLAQRSLNNYLE
jgi:hypothetical protein